MPREILNIYVSDPENNFTVEMEGEFIVYNDYDSNHHEGELVAYTITNMKELEEEDLSFMNVEYVNDNYEINE